LRPWRDHGMAPPGRPAQLRARVAAHMLLLAAGLPRASLASTHAAPHAFAADPCAREPGPRPSGARGPSPKYRHCQMCPRWLPYPMTLRDGQSDSVAVWRARQNGATAGHA
jgi:hypothetical protein